ncbi:MAG: hypothetical protein KA807_01675 [Prolixibacteraceae bacterium]|nr:hypothetical protein [Prolixibacteraceae bacterium]
MNKQLTALSILIFSVFLIINTGCRKKVNPNQDNLSKVESVSDSANFNYSGIKEQIKILAKKLNEPKDITLLLNEAGASYIADITLPVEYLDKPISNDKMSFYWGMYIFDMLYAKTYNREDQFLKLRENENKLKMNLGLSGELNEIEKYNERIKINKDNSDSVNTIIEEASEVWFKQMADNHTNTLIYSIVGNNVEALYILTQLTLLASDNSKLLTIVNEQHSQINTLFSLIEIIKDDVNIKTLYDDLNKVSDIFKNNPSITVKELNEIAPKIEIIRNKILN